jgi:hypothetical protein
MKKATNQPTPTYKFPEQLSPKIADGTIKHLKNIYNEQLFHEETRTHIKTIISEYVRDIEFVNVVRKYAGMEIDQRSFISAKYWISIIIASVITGIVGIMINKFF